MKYSTTIFWTLWFLISALTGWLYTPSHELSRSLKWGYDAFGRSLFFLVPYASLYSITISLLSVLTASAIGLTVALVIESSGPFRKIAVQSLELTLSFPSILLGLSWAAIFGSGYDTLFFALTVGAIPPIARFFQLRLVELRSEPFIEAAQSLGGHPLHIAWRHHLPARVSSYQVKVPNLISGALLAEAGLSFLGIGAPLGATTWGTLLAQARDYLIEAPHIAFISGIPLFLMILSLERFSDMKSKKVLLR